MTLPQPAVLIVTADTLRADHISGYGYGRQTTPTIDGVMNSGVAFTAAYTAMPTTGPSHTSLFTGTYPRTHGVMKNGIPFGAELPTLAGVLAQAGYRTGAVVSAFPVAARFGLARGFDAYDDHFTAAEASIQDHEWEGFDVGEAFDRRADATTTRALAWLGAVPDQTPWLLWVHYYDVHGPYDPPDAYRARFAPTPDRSGKLGREIAAYDAEARFMDDQLARLMTAVDRRFGPEQVFVVVATDHGEGLMDHGWMEHGIDLYEELVRVGLVFRGPGIVAGARSTVPVGLIDVAPTLLGLLGLPPQELRAEGVDLSAVLRGRAQPPARPLFFERRLYTTRDQKQWPAVGAMTAVRDGAWKLIEAPGEGTHELFDLQHDPSEQHNRYDGEGATRARLAQLLSAWESAPRTNNAVAPVDPADAARLRALGYVE